MKRRELLVVNLLLIALVTFFGWITFRHTVNHSSANTSQKVQTATTVQKTQAAPCTKTTRLRIDPQGDPNLNRLNQYQDLCSSFVTNKLMIFIGFSEDKQVAAGNATRVAAQLQKFNQAKVSPIVVAEPYLSDQLMSYKKFLSGTYDTGMNAFFQNLKDAGITDQMMGMWVPFPESNTPSWDNKDTEPHDYALCVNKYLTMLKQYFPTAKGSILLNATTYDPDDINYDNGNYASLSPYVSGIDRKLVTSVGIQGFPWVSNAQQTRRSIFKSSEFLQPDLAIGMAQVLHTRDIWINTGSFGSKYTNDPAKTVHLSSAERKALLDDIIQTAVDMRDYQENQYRVSINLFSEDKSKTNEATDWSYFGDADSQAVLKNFLTKANNAGIPISVSDKTK